MKAKFSYASKPLLALLLASLFLTGCGKGKAKSTVPDVSQSAEPDKILYEKAMVDLQKGRQEIARLTLNTLINTYQDSEYLAKAKLAIADSYYSEGTSSSLTQAIAEYKDFRTFFEFLDEAAYAQYRIGMAHFRRMEKPDRDRTHAKMAEQEFQDFILKYPGNKLFPDAEQRLREVQEVLAEGDFRIARFYFLRDTQNARRAAILRLSEIVDRYPLYSQADRALWMLGDALAKAEQTQHIATRYFARIVQDYPFSPYVEDAKAQLVKANVPVPQPNPDALARFQKEKELGRERAGMTRRALGIFKAGPDLTAAARSGPPNLTPPSDLMGGESLNAANREMNLSGSVAPNSGNAVTVVPTAPGATSESTSKTDDATPAKPIDITQKTDEAKKKEEEEKKKKESSSKKKKGLRKLIPW